jgi:hypothetical protein
MMMSIFFIRKYEIGPGTLVNTYNLNTWQAEAEDKKLETSLHNETLSPFKKKKKERERKKKKVDP